MLIIVFVIEFGICRDVFFMFEVFLLKIVCSSFFFGVSWVLFFGVILLIRMLLFFIFVLMYMMLDLLSLDRVVLFMLGMLVVIFFVFSLVLCVI